MVLMPPQKREIWKFYLQSMKKTFIVILTLNAFGILVHIKTTPFQLYNGKMCFHTRKRKFIHNEKHKLLLSNCKFKI